MTFSRFFSSNGHAWAVLLGLLMGAMANMPAKAAEKGEFYMNIPMQTIEAKNAQGHLRAITFEISLAFRDETNYKAYSGQKGKVIASIQSALRQIPFEDYLYGNAAQVVKDSARQAAQAIDPQSTVNEVLVKFLLVQ